MLLRLKRWNVSYQKKYLDKKFASSTGDFCILSAPPVWFLCTWVVPVRVAHICVLCAAPCPQTQRGAAHLFYPPLCSSGRKMRYDYLVQTRDRFLSALCVSLAFSMQSLTLWVPVLSGNAMVRGQSIFYGLAKPCGDARHFHAGEPRVVQMSTELKKQHQLIQMKPQVAKLVTTFLLIKTYILEANTPLSDNFIDNMHQSQKYNII